MGPASRNFCSAAVPFSGEHDLTARGPCFIPAVNRFKHFSVNLHITAFFFNVGKVIPNLPVLSVSKTNTPYRAVQAEIPVLQVSGTCILGFPVLLL